ncbi:hypothetical protein FRC03_005839 [Tulasnella sp. 419]|nr:hypothetical protein FRC03_005839 [Tulasnella sp. 419]
MDAFCRTAGPSKQHRAENVAKDPYAAARFFNFVITTLLETVFGVEVRGASVKSHTGIYGKVTGYFGVVEAQGRGTLHLHMLVWLDNAPTPDELLNLLKSEDFRARIVQYIKSSVRTNVDTLCSEEAVKKVPKDSQIAYSHPPNPDSPSYTENCKEMVQAVARSCQIHTCTRDACLRLNSKGVLKCKRKALWPLVDADYIKENGDRGSLHKYGYINAFNWELALMLRSNHDVKVLTNGEETKNITWYTTCYATKKQAKSYNLSAVLADKLVYHMEDKTDQGDVIEQTRKLLFRVVHVLNQGAEFSGPQVISYLMGWGDHRCSHRYQAVYWSSLECELKKAFPCLGTGSRKRKELSREGENADLSTEPQVPDVDDMRTNPLRESQDPDEETSEMMTVLVDQGGNVVYRSQLTDYMYRGSELSEYSLLDMIVDTYEEPIKKRQRDEEEDSNGQAHYEENLRNTRSRYEEGHPKAGVMQRVVRKPGHNNLPSFVGPYIPRSDDPDRRELYYASMLALFKPWRKLSDLKAQNTWEETYQEFHANTSSRKRRVISNMQLYYQCLMSAEKHEEDADINDDGEETAERPRKRRRLGHDNETENGELNEANDDVVEVNEEDWRMAMSIPKGAERELKHGREAVEIGKAAGIFNGDGVMNLDPGLVEVADNTSWELLSKWKASMKAQVGSEGDDEAQENREDEEAGNEQGKGKGKGKGRDEEGDVIPLEGGPGAECEGTQDRSATSL